MTISQEISLPGLAHDPVLDRIETELSVWRRWLDHWCNINTGSRNVAGLSVFLPLLEQAFAVLPCTMSRIPLEPEAVIGPDGVEGFLPGVEALHVQVRPAAPVQIAMTGHYDTVFPAGSTFQTVRTLEPGMVNGPGVADMKGGILVMLEALKAFEAHPAATRVGYQILLSPDEEVGSLGSAPVLARIGAECDLGMTYEPALADGSMAGARKGSGNFSLVIHGRAAHVGRAHNDGRSAIAAAAQFVSRIEALNGQRDGVTVNTGRIDGGGPNNVVPDLAIVRFNIRAPDAEAKAWADAALDAAIATVAGADGLHVHLHGGWARPPKPRTPGLQRLFDDVTALGATLGLSIRFKDTGGVCEGNNLAASGCPNIDTL
ncbi:MAG: hydrolase, partial [Hyphomonadaceae bacterium]|nr:hydrolase [Hyphomonadaceae bacterium]